MRYAIKIKILITASILSVISLQYQIASAADSILILGGGGEPVKSQTQFDDSLTNLGEFLDKSNKWNQSISFNGGHSVTDEILSTKFKTPNNAFTAEEYIIQIKALKNKIENSKEGDQVLLFLDTHGAANNGTELTHSVATNTNLVNLDNLKELTILAKTKKIKLAIIDLSCHSGNTLKLEQTDNNSTCIISGSSPNNFAFSDFSNSFTKNMNSGKNLEEVFLAARMEQLSRGIPQINTPAGKLVQEKQLLIESSLYYDLNDPLTKINKLDDYMLKVLKANSCTIFSPNPELIDLINKAEEMSKISNKYLFGSKATIEDFSLLKSKLNEYSQLQNDLKISYLKFGEFKKIKESFISGNGPIAYSQKEILEINTSQMIEAYQKAINEIKEVGDASFYQKYIDMYKDIKIRQDSLRIESNGIKMNLINEEIKSKSIKANELTTIIAQEERKFYDSLYKSLQKEEAVKTARNPCRDFVL
jgi:hypothetical protein